MDKVIPFNYNGHSVQFKADGWINATDAAARFGKRPVKWRELPSTKNYIVALAKALGVSKVPKKDFGLIVTQRGGSSPATWIHPKLAVVFARWLSDDFAVWCDLHIDGLLRGGLTELEQFEHACRKLDAANANASVHGCQLAKHRWQKPKLVNEVMYWREQLQRVFDFPDDTPCVKSDNHKPDVALPHVN